jgi:ABC-2 type transport system permease protein
MLADEPTTDDAGSAASTEPAAAAEPNEAAKTEPASEEPAPADLSQPAVTDEAAEKAEPTDQVDTSSPAAEETGGEPKETTADEKAKPESTKPAVPTTPAATGELSVVLVADIDCLYSAFFAVRARGMDQDDFANFDFDNVTFVLNTLDSLSGDKRFIDIRKRRFAHRTLSKLTEATAVAREQAEIARTQFNDEFEKAEAEAQKNFRDEIAKIEKRKSTNLMEVMQELEIAKEQGQRKLETKVAQLTKKRDRELKQIDRDLALNVRQVQDWYKTAAVLLPPIPPLLVGLYVFFSRRAREREGVSKSRLR